MAGYIGSDRSCKRGSAVRPCCRCTRSRPRLVSRSQSLCCHKAPCFRIRRSRPRVAGERSPGKRWGVPRNRTPADRIQPALAKGLAFGDVWRQSESLRPDRPRLFREGRHRGRHRAITSSETAARARVARWPSKTGAIAVFSPNIQSAGQDAVSAEASLWLYVASTRPVAKASGPLILAELRTGPSGPTTGIGDV
ncbi:hypothetical protein ACVIW2_000019 [Bradyrhizobium huanghuaihaiense]